MVIAALAPIAASGWTREAARTGPGSNPGGHGRAPAGPRRKTWVRFTRVGQAGYNSAVTRAPACGNRPRRAPPRSEEHTSELQSLMRISYAVFCLKKKTTQQKPAKMISH